MESSTAHYTTTKVNKVRRIIVEERLPHQKATPASKKEQIQKKTVSNIINFAKICLLNCVQQLRTASLSAVSK
jgi:hypothetical protein